MSAEPLELRGPVIVHVRTQKGRGFRPAEADQVGFHGAALPPITVPVHAKWNGTGNGSSAAGASAAPATSPQALSPAPGAMPTESMADDAAPASSVVRAPKNPNYTAV